jgi:hypothetical protein
MTPAAMTAAAIEKKARYLMVSGIRSPSCR